MLDRGDMNVSRIAEDGAKIGRADFSHQRAQLDAVAALVGAGENNAGIGIGRDEVNGNWSSAMNPYTGQRYARLERRLVVVQVDPHKPVPITPARSNSRSRLLPASGSSSPRIPIPCWSVA